LLYHIVRIIARIILTPVYFPRMLGRNKIPKTGKVIVYANHASWWDPVILGILLPRPVHFMAKEELFKSAIGRWFFTIIGAFPVKRGRADLSAVKKALKLLKHGKVFGIFPEGTRIKTGELGTFLRGVAGIAHHSRAPIIPIAIHHNKYRLFVRVTAVVGEPVDLSAYYPHKMDNEIAGNIMADLDRSLREIID
jgi:1-acyl-sn-glycerol-3-phosphate acyltransferase